jgi:hypothetical protein
VVAVEDESILVSEGKELERQYYILDRQDYRKVQIWHL